MDRLCRARAEVAASREMLPPSLHATARYPPPPVVLVVAVWLARSGQRRDDVLYVVRTPIRTCCRDELCALTMSDFEILISRWIQCGLAGLAGLCLFTEFKLMMFLR
jgi:hypothetical protein